MTTSHDAGREAIAQIVYDFAPVTFEDRVDGTCFMPWQQAKDESAPHVRHAYKAADRILALTRPPAQAGAASVECGAKPDHADIMETIQSASDTWQKDGYTSALAEVRDMANVGRALMEALPKGYYYMDCPSEIVSDLQNQLDEARATPAASGEIPAGMKPWHGGDSAPADWDGGMVALDNGAIGMLAATVGWARRPTGNKAHIIAYTPKASAETGEALGPLWRKVQQVATDAYREDWSVAKYRAAMIAALSAAPSAPATEAGEEA